MVLSEERNVEEAKVTFQVKVTLKVRETSKAMTIYPVMVISEVKPTLTVTETSPEKAPSGLPPISAGEGASQEVILMVMICTEKVLSPVPPLHE